MRKPAPMTVEGVIRDAIAAVVQRATASIQKVIAAELAAGLKAAKGSKRASASRSAPRKSRRAARKELTKWVADVRARRVPNFVIEATGLDTKKKIVAKFGENAAFTKGTPLPAAIHAIGASASRAKLGSSSKRTRSKAKATVVRKKVGTAAR